VVDVHDHDEASHEEAKPRSCPGPRVIKQLRQTLNSDRELNLATNSGRQEGKSSTLGLPLQSTNHLVSRPQSDRATIDLYFNKLKNQILMGFKCASHS
jgi:hypothetical protein